MQTIVFHGEKTKEEKGERGKEEWRQETREREVNDQRTDLNLPDPCPGSPTASWKRPPMGTNRPSKSK